MGFDLEISVSAAAVFTQGILSFFSPCVLPLLPLYIGYLSGGTARKTENGERSYDQKKVMLNTFFFVVGVSFAFFLLGLGVSAVGTFFNHSQVWIARAGGVLIVLFGCFQLGLFQRSGVFGKEWHLPFRLEQAVMSPLTALLMGFTFSFSWTPCVGPALASVLIMTASAKSRAEGFWLIGLYTLGFVIPFLLVGLFTAQILSLFKKHRGIVRYTVKIGGILLILTGVLMITGKMGGIAGYFARISGSYEAGQESPDDEMEAGMTEKDTEEPEEDSETEAAGAGEPAENQETETAGASSEDGTAETLPAFEFSLSDQYGTVHTLDEYRGKIIFMNFWATWCPPCRNEMPDIQKLYEKYEQDEDSDVAVIGVAAPGYGQEVSESEIKAFLKGNGYTYPVLMDYSAELFRNYEIYSLPTTFMIDRDGNVYGYLTGQMDEKTMESIIRQTMDGSGQ